MISTIPEEWKYDKLKPGKKLLINLYDLPYNQINQKDFILCTVKSCLDDNLIVETEDIHENLDQKEIHDLNPRIKSEKEFFKLDTNRLTDKSGKIFYYYDLFKYYTKNFSQRDLDTSYRISYNHKEYVDLVDVNKILNTKINKNSKEELNLVINELYNNMDPFATSNNFKIYKKILFNLVNNLIQLIKEDNFNIGNFLTSEYNILVKKCLIWNKYLNIEYGEIINKFCCCKSCLDMNKKLLDDYVFQNALNLENFEDTFIIEIMIPEFIQLLENYDVTNSNNFVDIISSILEQNFEDILNQSFNEEQKRPTPKQSYIDNLKVESWDLQKHSDMCLLCQTSFKDMNNPKVIHCNKCQISFCAGDKDGNICENCEGLYRWFKEADVCPHCNTNIVNMVKKKQKQDN